MDMLLLNMKLKKRCNVHIRCYNFLSPSISPELSTHFLVFGLHFFSFCCMVRVPNGNQIVGCDVILYSLPRSLGFFLINYLSFGRSWHRLILVACTTFNASFITHWSSCYIALHTKFFFNHSLLMIITNWKLLFL